MANFIDRRLNSKNKSTVNRQRFIKRYKSQIKKSVEQAINKRSVTDVERGEDITITKKDLSEPFFHQGKGGIKDRVHPGNDQFSTGDQIKRPQQQQGQGSGKGDASNTGEGNDDFIFSISRDEYLNLLFEDLELPNLEKNQLDTLIDYKTVRSGYCAEGVPSNIDIVKSLQGSIARRIAMTSTKRKKLKVLELALAALMADKHDHVQKIKDLNNQIDMLKDKISKVPFIDTFDLRFRNYAKQALPTSKAVMFCLMDVSGSMDQATKDIAKRFYLLLYLFLTRTYKTIDVIYIRHHTQAKEVDEEEFFYSQETGGTIASSALDLMIKIMDERYKESEWNIYAAQASDGDNWADDSPRCQKLLTEHILPKARYFSYIEISQRPHQTLWQQYQEIAAYTEHFAIQHIKSVEDIYPVFRELFKKKQSKAA
ncbi:MULTISPECIES: YeaH/YhbH family protein [unclassified Colwellia]|uniref:YeaH/YhbH family protein n=1 Tax=unclassified Colwellia TaxID=196834 RepID=UPI0015F53B05|nr:MULTISPECIES: YeaH/YhbH family protein [unclassified Colwellia]MBA6231946.1 YeaH/YhbH family protein [Colwellia sp. MB02u-7]MBA6235881.1 YeaH/YhbH family protein [Colwellia sp. MB02u-11]MBA6255283.1 YeaH/YhbH family protein [Colwellia sp. MB3u-28]MBA6258552.1 YeaH/YhbH family protein [Colwellia sp. MB3u-41]MBA6298704.1 YeaH/YhbH family protein [Colwellia sp. MB3u-22]